VLGVPDPSKSPAQGSLIVLFFAMLLMPLGVDPGPGQAVQSVGIRWWVAARPCGKYRIDGFDQMSYAIGLRENNINAHGG
jgi:hypothetical protein